MTMPVGETPNPPAVSQRTTSTRRSGRCTRARTRVSPVAHVGFCSCFLITHAHLDHINGLVLSAGTLKGPRKRIHAARHVIDNIETVFSDRVWPKLASWSAKDDDYKLLYDPYVHTTALLSLARAHI